MSSPPFSSFPPSGRLLESAGLPRRVHEALEMTLELVDESIAAPLGRVLPALADQVTAVSEFGSQHRVNVDMVDASGRLLRDGTAMTRLFLAAIERELAALRDPAATPAPAATAAMPSFGELRLVDEDDDDVATLLGALALRHESRSPLTLQLLCQRFGVLAASPAFEPGTLPVGPRRLGELLVEAATSAGFGLQLTASVLREFDRQVLTGYEGFAETLNGLLSRLGVMPGLSYVPLRTRARPTGEVRGGDGEAIGAPGASASMQPPGGAPGADAGHDADPAVFELLQHMLATRRGMAERFRHPEPTGRTRPPLETGAALQLLAQAGPAQPAGDFESIRQWLLLQARQKHGEAMTLSAADADALELLGLLYSQLADEVRSDTPATRMLDRLRLPLVRLALRDHGFFVRPGHPARQLLNLVAETGAARQTADDVDPLFLQQIQHAVDEVARAPGDVEGAFTEAVQTLDAQQQVLARRAEMAERRSVEAARGKERLAVARRRAAAVIENAMASLRLPVFHRNMLRQAWADVLTLAHLRHGEDAEEWLSLVGDTRDLALAGAGSAAAPEGLAAQVEQWLVTVGHHADDATRIARILTASQEDERDDAASRTELAMRIKSRARLGEDTKADAPLLPPRSPAEEAAFQRLRTLPFGTWMTFETDDGSLQRRRLAWWSPSTGSALFVNPRGQRVAESTLDAVARDVAAGRARILPADEAGLVDRAWRTVVRSLRSMVPGGGKETPA